MEVHSGRRGVKGYPVSRDELLGLGGVGLGATLCFSAGFSYLTRSADIGRNLEFSSAITEKGLPDKLVAKWEAKSEDAFTFGCILIVVGIIAVVAGGAKIWSIIDSTEHDK